ncbi:MAG: nucleotidyltransferase domain-containing protein [Candidatus Omnitrophota bacterium]
MIPNINTKLKRNLLCYVFTHPDESFYIRELSGLIGEDAGNLSRELRKMEENGLFLSRIKGREKNFSLNKNYPFYAELKAIIAKSEGVQGRLRDLVERYPGIKLAFLYGSYASGRLNKKSDIDLFLAGSFDYDKFTGDIRKLESKLNREINFSYFPLAEFAAEKKKAGGFLNLVLKEKVIVLKGALNVQ